jgi:hypothetical protein
VAPAALSSGFLSRGCAFGIVSKRLPLLDSSNDCPIIPAADSEALGFRVAARLAKEISEFRAAEVVASLDSEMTHDLSASPKHRMRVPQLGAMPKGQRYVPPKNGNVANVVLDCMRGRAVQQYGLRSHPKPVFVAWSQCVNDKVSQAKRERLDLLIVSGKKRAQLRRRVNRHDSFTWFHASRSITVVLRLLNLTQKALVVLNGARWPRAPALPQQRRPADCCR